MIEKLRGYYLMKYKICLLLIAVFIGNISLGQSGRVQQQPFKRPTAIQSTNMVFKDTNYNLKNDYTLAINELRNRIKIEPNNYELNVSLTELYIKTKQFDNAFEELIFLCNLSKQNKLDFETKEEINRLLEKTKRNAKYDADSNALYIDIALMSLIMDETENAEKYIILASQGAANNSILKKATDYILQNETNPQKVINLCNSIIAKNPNDIKIRKLKALNLVQTKNSDEAIEEYQNILTINPDDKDSKYYLYKLLTEKNYSQKDIIKKLYSKNTADTEKIYSELAEILYKNNNISEAKKYAAVLSEKFPQNETGHMILAEIYQKEGNLEASYEALAKLRDTADSSEAVAKYNVLMAKLSDKPVEQAKSLMSTGLYQQALDVLDSANQENLYVILTQVKAQYLLGNKQASMELLNKAMSLYPDNSDVYCSFGWVYLQEKDIDSARKYTDNSLKLNPENGNAKELLDMVNQAESDTYMNKIISYYESQNYSEAMRLIDEAISINNKDSALYFYKALTYIAQNNYAASTAALYKAVELDKNNATAYFYLGLAFDNLSEQKNALEYYTHYVNMLSADDYLETERKEYATARINQLNKH